MSPLNGVLPVDKPAGPTSHDIVAQARRALGLRRIGHTGTLDPFASGLLLLCLGPATRLAEYLTALPKSYDATLRLGVVTQTDDTEGEVVRSSDDWRSVDRGAVEDALSRQVGEIDQVPPLFSAKRVGGERVYDIARRGGTVDLEPVRVRIDRVEITRFEPPDVDFQVDCSSGTYIRAIARDAGEFLGVGAHLRTLRRTRIGSFTVAAALSPDGLSDAAAVGGALLSPSAALAHLSAVELSDEEMTAVRNGRPLRRDLPSSPEPVRLIASNGALAAIGEVTDGAIRPRKVFL